MTIIPYVCAEFRDSKGNTLFTIRPDMLRGLHEVPESIRQDPLFGMLVRDGSICTPEITAQKKRLEQDPMFGITAEGRRIVDAGGASEGDSEVSRNKRSSQGALSRPLPVADEGRGNVDKPIEAADKKVKSSKTEGKQETPSDGKEPGQPESGKKEAGTEAKTAGK